MATMGFVVVALSNPSKNLFIHFVSKINFWGYAAVRRSRYVVVVQQVHSHYAVVIRRCYTAVTQQIRSRYVAVT